MQDLTRYCCQPAVKERKTRRICSSLTLDNREAAQGWFIKNTFMFSSSTWFINLNITADFGDENTWLWLDERIPILRCDWSMRELVIAGERNDDVDCPRPGVIRFKLYNCWRQHLIIVSLNPHCRADLPRLCQIGEPRIWWNKHLKCF